MFRNILVAAGIFVPAILQAQMSGDPPFRPTVTDFRRPVSELRRSNRYRLDGKEAGRCPRETPRIPELLLSTLGGVTTGAFVHAIAYAENPEGRRRTRATFLGVGAAYGLTLGFLHPRRSCKFGYVPQALPDGFQKTRRSIAPAELGAVARGSDCEASCPE